MNEIDHIQSNMDADESSTTIRFFRNVSNSKVAPKFRYQIALTGMFAGLVLDGVIFQDDKDGSFSVKTPGSGKYGSPLVAAPKLIEVNGQTMALEERAEDGLNKLERWEPRIKGAFLAFLQTKQSEQRVSF